MRKDLKTIQLDKDVHDLLCIQKVKHTPALSFSDTIKYHLNLVMNAETKINEFIEKYGEEAVTGSNSGDLSVKEMKRHMAKQLIFKAAAYSGIDPARLIIRDTENGDEIGING